ncbi:MAG TPA: hypothetical protein DCO79_10090 [Spirochaeta sp.]|nr:hypothetical protein [Spirochaeta sp.]
MLSSIQGKSTFYIIIVVMLFLAALLLVNYLLLRDFSIEQAERTSSLILNSADSQLEISFNEIEALTSSLSSLRAVREVDIDDMSELFINNVLVRNDNVRALYLGTEDGGMFEWGVGEGFTDFTPVFPEGYDPRVRPWYQLAVEENTYGLTSPYIFASIDALGITAVRPVRNSGELVGVIGLDLILHGLGNLVSSLNVPMGGKVILLNQDKQMLVNQFSPTTDPVTELDIFPYSEIINVDEPFIKTEVYGDFYMISSVKNAATGWTMLLFLPYREIMDFSQNTIQIIIVFDLLLMFLLGSLIAFITRSLVTNPLDKIISIFRLFESGKKSARIPELPGQEFNLIARLFNNLSDLSAESSQRMEEKVEQRTRAVIRLQKENVRLRIIEEKERIYGNLHDSLGARLTSINISNHVAKSAVERDEKPVLKEMLERIEKNTGQGILELKEILAADKTLFIPGREFTVFLDVIIRERLALKDISLEIEGEASDVSMLEPEFTAGLEKIMLELVSNTMKYSGAKKVTKVLKSLT